MTVLKTFVSDLRGSVRLAANAGSRFRLSLDFALSRFIGLVPGCQRNRVREVRLCGDIKIRYRLNKGDLHSIREIWLEEAYRLPFEDPSGVLLDLGANIGMASLYQELFVYTSDRGRAGSEQCCTRAPEPRTERDRWPRFRSGNLTKGSRGSIRI